MPTKTLSTMGMKCPKPLFEVHLMMKRMDPGQLLEVFADDPAFKPDIQAWCRRTGHELRELRREDDRFIALIKKS
jgi:TusA-related sulfurtransferase